MKNRTLNNIIERRCLSIDFTNKVGSSEAEVFHGEFALSLSKIDEFLDTETPGEQFGLSDVYGAKNELGKYRKMATWAKWGR